MSNKLEDFLHDNKDEFDGFEPSEALWNRIEKRIDEPKKNGLLVSIGARKWMYAAAAVVVIAFATIFVTNQPGKTENPGIAKEAPKVTPAIIDTDTTQPQLAATAPEQQTITEPTTRTIKKDDQAIASNDALKNIADEELVHYTKLVELKQQQITILKKDEPLLYKQFASDFAKIDEDFNELKKQKNSHPNNEQLLEAMIQNLRMQSALLNRQLEIVKTINNNKKKRYEKTYNSSI